MFGGRLQVSGMRIPGNHLQEEDRYQFSNDADTQRSLDCRTRIIRYKGRGLGNTDPRLVGDVPFFLLRMQIWNSLMLQASYIEFGNKI
jgi:hypothetical protein